MISKIITITNPAGFHLRPAGILCREASKYTASVHYIYKNSTYNAKSVLSVLGSCVRYGDVIDLICEGADETEALAGVSAALENGLIG